MLYFSVSQTKNTTSDAYIAYYASIAHSFYTVFIVLAVLEQKAIMQAYSYYMAIWIYGLLSKNHEWSIWMDIP